MQTSIRLRNEANGSPFGGEAGTQHFTSKTEAQAYSEKTIAANMGRCGMIRGSMCSVVCAR